MRITVALSALALLCATGCESAAESMTETMVEAATGSEIEIDKDGKQVTIKTDDGVIKVDGNEEGGRAVVTGPDGQKAVFNAGKEVPEGFPLPIIDGGEVKSATQMAQKDGAMFNVTLVTAQSPAEAAEFYTKVLKEKGFEPRRNEVKAEKNVMIMVNGQNKEARVMIQATKRPKDEQTTVMLNWVAGK